MRLLLLLAVMLLLASLFKSEQSQKAQVVHLISSGWLLHAEPEKLQSLKALLEDSNNAHIAIQLETNEPLSLELLQDNIGQIRRENNDSKLFTNVWYQVAMWWQLNPEGADKIVVHSSNKLSEFVGEKFRLLPDIEWDIVESNNVDEIVESIELTVIVMQPSDSQKNSKQQIQTKAVLAALKALYQLPPVSIQVYQYPNEAIESILDKALLQKSLAIIEIGSRQAQALQRVVAAMPEVNVIDVDDLGSVARNNFPITLVNNLLDQALNQAFWQSASLSAEVIANNETGRSVQATSLDDNYSQSLPNEPSNIPTWLMLACVLLFACERIYSERLTKHSRFISTPQVSSDNV